MAEQAQVLRDLGSGWQECLDTQGVFYFNSVTGQSQDTLPQEFAKVEPVYQQEVQPEAPYAVQGVQGVQGQPAGPEEATVKMQLGVWSICEDNQGEFYHNATTGQTFDQPPPELLELYEQSQGGPAVDAQPAPVYHQAAAPVCQAAAPAYQASAPAYEASAPVGMSKEKPVEQEEATVKMTVGVWSVCEDQQGEYYHNGTTGQTFDSPPPEFVELLQGSQWAAHDAPVYQAQAAPVYQSSVSQGVPVYHTASVAQGLSVYRTPGAQGAPVYQVSTVAQHAPVQQTVPINSTVALTTATTSPAVFHVASADQSPMLQMSSSQLNPQYVHHQPTHQQSLSVYPAAPGPSPQHVSQGVYKPAGDHAQVHSVRSNMNPCC